MRNILLAGAAMAAGLVGFAVPSLAQPARTEGADVGNAVETNGRLSAGQAISGKLDPSGDVDWYRIRLNSGRSYRFTLAGDGEGALPDPVLNVYGAQGGEAVATNDDSGGSLNSALTFTPERSGNYFLAVSGFGDSPTGGYVLTSTRGERPPAPQAMAIGQEASGIVNAAGERDRFRVALVGGQTYRFSVHGSGESPLRDPYLALLNASGGGEPLAQDDDSGGELAPYLEFTAPTSGNYLLETRAFNDEETGAYTLTSRSGDVPAAATTDVSLTIGSGSRLDRLQPQGDSDWFKLDLTQGQTVRIKLDSGGAEPALADPLLVVHGPDGAELARDDDSGDGLNSYLEFTASSAGSYYAEARGFQDGALGAYQLTVSDGEVPATAETDEALSATDPRQSRIGAAGDADWFRVNLVEGRTYRFNVESGGDAAFDPLLALLGPDGAKLVEDDDGGTGANAYLTYTASKNGDYFAAVSAFGAAATGAYTVRMSDAEVPGDQGTDENLQGSDDSRVSRIDFAGDNDAYNVAVTAGQRYRVTVAGANPGRLAGGQVAVKKSDGTAIASAAGAVTFTAPEGESQVLVVVTGARNATGTYNVAVRQLP